MKLTKESAGDSRSPLFSRNGGPLEKDIEEKTWGKSRKLIASVPAVDGIAENDVDDIVGVNGIEYDFLNRK